MIINDDQIISQTIYDYCLDTISDEKKCEKYKKASPIEKYIMYCDDKGIGDPDDKSDQLQSDIKKLWWKDLENSPYMYKHKHRIWSDTMTSVSSSINSFLKQSEDELIGDRRIVDIKNELFGKRGKYSKSLSVELYKIDKDSYSKIVQPFANLVCLAHTIGNYCPVPIGFNSARSGCGHYDYWDITLSKICEYYQGVESEEKAWSIIGQQLLHGTGNGIACKCWLDSFGRGKEGWTRFVEGNYFDDYVDKDGDLVAFFQEHDWEHPDVKKKDITEFASKVSKRICRRGIRLSAKLNDSTVDEQDVDRIETLIMDLLKQS